MIFYLGIDNGVSGSFGWVDGNREQYGFFPTPTFSELDYTKTERHVTRLDLNALIQKVHATVADPMFQAKYSIHVIMERPMINPMRFRATISAIRAWEATLIFLSMYKWSRITIDSKEWQKQMLPKGITGPANLKEASKQVGCRLFPHLKDAINKHGDADSILIAEWGRRNKR
uniref:Uncharacterized protein n=1 Tax=viral metagenome TaxID=1070528 RepID=A0A6M3IMZ7_9ZZZZ